MAASNWLSQNLYLPLNDIFGNTRFKSSYNFLLKSQWWSREHLMEHQNQRFLAILHHAYEHVPFYRKLYQKKQIHPSDIKDLSEIKKLPVITKDELRKAPLKDKLADNLSRKQLFHFCSSGSTGSPFEYYMCSESYSMKYAAALRGWSWMGYKLGDYYAKLSQNKRQSYIKKIQDFFNRSLYLFIPNLRDDNLIQMIQQLNRYKPSYIRCYPDPLVFLARVIQNGTPLSFIPKGINTTGNILTDDMRKKIENAFECPVFDSYSLEGSALYYQIPEYTGYLGSSEQAYTEIILNGSDVKTGSNGMHVTTDLYNMAMPFIRYDTGDLLEKADQITNAERNLYAVNKILGRDTDVLITPDGDRLIVHLFTIYFEYIKEVIQFQIEQTRADHFIFRLVVDQNFSKEIEKRIIKDWQYKLGKESKLVIQIVKEIPSSKSKKQRFLIRNKDITLL